MTARSLGALIIALAPLTAWLLALAIVTVTSRPRAPRPAPPTPELGPEPPALVNLLVHGNDVTEDAVDATLLDLAARRIIELRAPDNNPAHTTVHVPVPTPPGLAEYEQRVLRRIADRAVGGVAPLTALTFSDPAEADTWMHAMREDVIHDARQHGLTTRRTTPGPMIVLLFLSFAIPAGFCLAPLYGGVTPEQTPNRNLLPMVIGAVCCGMPLWLVLFYGSQRVLRGMALSGFGRQRAEHWLGVRDWLAQYPSFAELPPAAAAVWDRYLAYGAALGVTLAANRAIRLGVGGRRTPWSSYGGRWRRVRVQPLHLPRLRALLPPLGRPTTITGQVLWVDGGTVAIDDGAGDATRPWMAPRSLVADVRGGDTVTATVRPWRRRITDLTVDRRGADSLARDQLIDVAPTVYGAMGDDRAGLRHTALADVIPADEASTVLRHPVRIATVTRPSGRLRLRTPIAGTGRHRAANLVPAGPPPWNCLPRPGTDVVHYVSTVDGCELLRLELLDLVHDYERWKAHPAGSPLAGVGDEASFGAGWAVARLGDDFLLAVAWPPADPSVPGQIVRIAFDRLAA